MFYVCIATGMADCSPDHQHYVSTLTAQELAATVDEARNEFIAEELADGFPEPYLYDFRVPRSASHTNWQQRIAIGHEHDRVLDVIGMTEADWRKEVGSALGGESVVL